MIKEGYSLAELLRKKEAYLKALEQYYKKKELIEKEISQLGENVTRFEKIRLLDIEQRIYFTQEHLKQANDRIEKMQNETNSQPGEF